MSVTTKQLWGNRIGALGALVTFVLNGLAATNLVHFSENTLGALNILVVGAAGAIYTVWTGEKAPSPE